MLRQGNFVVTQLLKYTRVTRGNYCSKNLVRCMYELLFLLVLHNTFTKLLIISYKISKGGMGPIGNKNFSLPSLYETDSKGKIIAIHKGQLSKSFKK